MKIFKQAFLGVVLFFCIGCIDVNTDEIKNDIIGGDGIDSTEAESYYVDGYGLYFKDIAITRDTYSYDIVFAIKNIGESPISNLGLTGPVTYFV